MTRIAILLPLLALAACATPEARLQAGLQKAGLSPRMSACMADRMVDALSLVQLRRLQSLGSLNDDRVRDLSTAEFLCRVRALRDAEILAETTKAAAACAIGL